MKMTNEQVDMVECLLRKAQENLEDAGVLVCGEPGEAAAVWYDLTKKAEEVGNAIHGLYKLRK